MRAPRFAILGCSLALLAAGCGGADTAVDEVPGTPVGLTVPGDADVLSPDATATPTASPTTDTTASATATATATPTPTATPSTTTGTTGATGATDTTGATTGDGGTGGASTGTTGTTTGDSPPPPGSDVQKFEEFCAQNPGAC